MSNDKKVELADFKQPINVSVHWPEHQAKPKLDTSLFRIQNEEFGGCDRRIKIRANLTHLVAGAEKHGENEIVCHPSLVADAIVDDIHQAIGYVNPSNLRFGATPNVHEAIGEEYRFIVTLAAQRLKDAYETHRSAQ